MDEEQWNTVRLLIADLTQPHQPPRNPQEQLQVDFAFSAVWRIIFPEQHEPVIEGFNCEWRTMTPMIQSLKLLEALYTAKAKKAVDDGIISSTYDFKPTPRECVKTIQQAHDIMVRGTRHYTAGEGQGQDDEGFRSAIIRAIKEASSYILMPPLPVTGVASSAPEVTLSGAAAGSTTAENVLSFPLQYPHTQFAMQLMSTPGQAAGELRVVLPIGTNLQSFMQLPVNPF